MSVLETATDVKQGTGSQIGENTWVQITFTLDPQQYRALWSRADHEHRTIPSCVRESVIDFLRMK